MIHWVHVNHAHVHDCTPKPSVYSIHLTYKMKSNDAPCIRLMRPRYKRQPKLYCPDVIEFHCGLNEGILLFWSIAL